LSTSINFGVIVIVVVFVVVVVEADAFFLARPLFLGSTTVEVVVKVIGACSEADTDVAMIKDLQYDTKG
jgi:capsular polysaccharide biosynthesis protein